MCEDRILHPKKATRSGRIEHIRQRILAANRNRQLIVAPQEPMAGVVPSAPHPAGNENMDPLPLEADDSWRKYRTQQQNNRDNLVEIAMRTLMLIRQNRQLQHKLAALQAETRVFMRSVMSDPENRRRATEQMNRAQQQQLQQQQQPPIVRQQP